MRIFRMLFLLLLPALLLAQEKKNAFSIIVKGIKQRINCCSVPFSGNMGIKVSGIIIFETGEITLAYNNGKIPVSFNLFELEKDSSNAFGIYYHAESKSIEFRITENNMQAIRFNSIKKAKETYDLFISLFKERKEQYSPGFGFGLNATVDSINHLLHIYNSDRAEIQILNDTVFKISQMPSIRYNIDVKKLSSSDELKIFQVKGISLIPKMRDGYGMGPRIKFYNNSHELGFMKFDQIPNEQIALIHRLFIHLRDLLIHRPKG